MAKEDAHFLLSSMSVVYVLTTTIFEDGENATMEQIRKMNKLGRWINGKMTIIYLRIEESPGVQDSDKPKSNNVAGLSVVNMDGDVARWSKQDGVGNNKQVEAEVKERGPLAESHVENKLYINKKEQYIVARNNLPYIHTYIHKKPIETVIIMLNDTTNNEDEGTTRRRNTTSTGGASEDENGNEGYTEDGTVDLRGNPVLRSKRGGWKACSFIVVYEVFERMAYYGISSNLIIYLTTKLRMGTVTSSNNVTNWVGTIWMTPILGAYFADAVLGRYWTFIISAAIYLTGMCLLTLAVSLPALKPPSCDSGTDCKKASTYANSPIFFSGASNTRFCTALIFFGSLFANTVLVYIQDNVGWSLGYGLPTLGLLISILIFLAGTPFYRHKVPTGSPFTKMAGVILAALHKWKVPVPSDPKLLHELDLSEYAKKGKYRIDSTPTLRFLNKACVRTEATSAPWMLCTVTEVEETKQILRMIPILIATFVPSTMIAQISTLFVKQGTTLERHIGSFEIPPAILNLLNFIFFLVMTKFYVYKAEVSDSMIILEEELKLKSAATDIGVDRGECKRDRGERERKRERGEIEGEMRLERGEERVGRREGESKGENGDREEIEGRGEKGEGDRERGEGERDREEGDGGREERAEEREREREWREREQTLSPSFSSRLALVLLSAIDPGRCLSLFARALLALSSLISSIDRLEALFLMLIACAVRFVSARSSLSIFSLFGTEFMTLPSLIAFSPRSVNVHFLFLSLSLFPSFSRCCSGSLSFSRCPLSVAFRDSLGDPLIPTHTNRVKTLPAVFTEY
ncbi:NRT1/ PTR family 5.2-like protein [Tanacetum coccineum]